MAHDTSSQRDLSVESLSPTVRGDWAELTATLWLIEQGYEVFKNCRHTGPIDLVAWKDGKVRLIDVKLFTFSKKSKWLQVAGSAPYRKDLGVEVLYVSIYGICAFTSGEFVAKHHLICGSGPRSQRSIRLVDRGPKL